ncbi:hypothetical protein, partial [Bacillus cereus]|uniref:hypothetical protein n=1 Tax=Bacillus cereus TaxID=1396 RepID=UPI0016901744
KQEAPITSEKAQIKEESKLESPIVGKKQKVLGEAEEKETETEESWEEVGKQEAPITSEKAQIKEESKL